MATVRPFRGLRFAESAGVLADLVAPPYDVVSSDQRAGLAGRSAHNVVHLTIPQQETGDRSKFVKYARCAAALEEWRREGVLTLEQRPSFYRYCQTFTVPGTSEVRSRTKLLTTIRLEPYSNGVVLPHEKTFPKHKEDRLRILEATRSHLECIFGLFEDEDGRVHSLIESAPGSTVADLTNPEDGIRNVIERVDDPIACASLVRAISDKRVWIADGHHRYETALAFREKLGPREGPVAEDFIMMALCSVDDPGLVLLPTHRIVKSVPAGAEDIETILGRHFRVSRAPNSSLLRTIANCDCRAIGVALPGGTGLVAKICDVEEIARQFDEDCGVALRILDVSILHGFIFEKLLGLTGDDFFDYTRDEGEALRAVEQGAPVAFLMNPPSVEDMRKVAGAGESMPQKSTYYYPKLLSGLVIWSLKDFEP